MPSVGAVGFWSYTHEDNDDEENRIVELGLTLQREYRLQTGEPFRLFIDRKELEWGDEWRRRIAGALSDATFFIPIITPRFFRSADCRQELLTFAGQAQSLGLTELIMPILYVHVEGLQAEAESSDEAMLMISRFQWEDWRELRLLDKDTSEYRQAVSRMAKRLADMSLQFSAEDSKLADQAEEPEEPPGLVDLLAEGEEALPEWGEALEHWTSLITSIDPLITSATEEMARSDAQGRGFAGRLHATRELARNLDPVAAQMEEVAQEFSNRLIKIDPAILALLRILREDPSQRAEAAEFLSTVRELATSATESVASTEELTDAITQNQELSRDLRKPLRRISGALTRFTDAKNIYEEWVRLIDELEAQN